MRTALLALLFLSLAPLYSAETATADQGATIRAARLAQNEAIVRHDLDAIASFWTEDVTICRGLGIQVAGKPAYLQLFSQDTKDSSPIVYERIPDEIAVSPDWPLAFETGHWIGRKANATVITGRYSAQWARRGDRWLIRSEVFVALHGEGEGKLSKAAP